MINSQLILLAEFMAVIAVTMLLTLSPKFTKRPLIFKYPRREAIIAFSLVVLLAGGLWLIFTRYPLTLPEKVDGVFSFPVSGMLPYLLVAVIIGAPFAVAVLVRGQPWLSTGLGKQTLRPSLQLGLALAVVTIFLLGKIYNLIDGISTSEINFLLAMLALGFAEEFAFRGYVQPRLSAWCGERWGWIVTAFLFTLWRIPQQILVTKMVSLPDLGIGLLDLLVFSLIQGWIMRKSGNVLAPALYHAFHFWTMYL
jgi:membrane protease YdiL (CAAX protease family)